MSFVYSTDDKQVIFIEGGQLSLFIIIIFYLNFCALQMKESLKSGPLETIRSYNCQLGIFRHRECPYRLD